MLASDYFTREEQRAKNKLSVYSGQVRHRTRPARRQRRNLLHTAPVCSSAHNYPPINHVVLYSIRHSLLTGTDLSLHCSLTIRYLKGVETKSANLLDIVVQVAIILCLMFGRPII
ncbi:unnamed protein product [Colias eurytheme]|nr:unnamed protein product [Colias eurytheme]